MPRTINLICQQKTNPKTLRLEYEKRNKAKEEKEMAVYKLAMEMKSAEATNEFKPVNLIANSDS